MAKMVTLGTFLTEAQVTRCAELRDAKASSDNIELLHEGSTIERAQTPPRPTIRREIWPHDAPDRGLVGELQMVAKVWACRIPWLLNYFGAEGP